MDKWCDRIMIVAMALLIGWLVFLAVILTLHVTGVWEIEDTSPKCIMWEARS